jgi:hypothetical protein
MAMFEHRLGQSSQIYPANTARPGSAALGTLGHVVGSALGNYATAAAAAHLVPFGILNSPLSAGRAIRPDDHPHPTSNGEFR